MKLTRAWWWLLCATTLAGAAPEPLAEALRAERLVPHVGRLGLTVYARGAYVTSEVELATDGAGRARRTHRSGPAAGLTVIDQAGWSWRRAAGEAVWQRDLPTTPALAAGGAAAIRGNYTVSVQPGPALLGRPTQHVTLTPRHPGQPSRDWWLDAQTGLCLKAEHRNRDGWLVARREYLTLAVRRPTAAELDWPGQARRETAVPLGGLRRLDSLAAVERELGRPPCQPTRLPPGYTLAAVHLKRCRRGGWTPLLAYTDGLNTLTVMEAGGGQAQPWWWRWWRRCTVQTDYSQVVLRTTCAGRTVVLVGDLAPRLMRDVAFSLR